MDGVMDGVLSVRIIRDSRVVHFLRQSVCVRIETPSGNWLSTATRERTKRGQEEGTTKLITQD
jgi:hypothetical protein